jgi:hypothetical protein
VKEGKTYHRGDLVGPVLLISLGVIFLLNNLGVLTWSVWMTIFRMWPVVLIAIGLDILIGRRSVWGALLALVLIAAVFAGGVWLFGVRSETGQTLTGEEIVQALDGATRAEVIIEPGVGDLYIEALTDSTNLVEGTIGLGGGGEVMRGFEVEGETARLTLQRSGTVGPFLGVGGEQWTWSLGINPDVPLDLEIGLGVGESTIDLTDMIVNDLDVSMGVGRSVVLLPAEGRFRARIEGAIGETVIVVPQGMGVRITTDTGLASSQVPDDYRCEDDTCTSPGYGSADDHVDLEASQAIGSLTLRVGD